MAQWLFPAETDTGPSHGVTHWCCHHHHHHVYYELTNHNWTRNG